MPRKLSFQHRKGKKKTKRCKSASHAPPPLPPCNSDLSVVPLPMGWTQQKVNEKHTFCKLSQVSSSSASPMAVSHSLNVFNDFSWVLYVYKNRINPSTCNALKDIPSQLTPDRVSDLLKALDCLPICAGQPDSNFIEMIRAKKGKITSSHGESVAFLDSSPIEEPLIWRQSAHPSAKLLAILRSVMIANGTETISVRYIIDGPKNPL